MTEDIGDQVLRIAEEIMVQRLRFLEWRITSMPRGMFLCLHDGVMQLDLPVANDHEISFAFSAHVIEDPVNCEWRGRREVYSVPDDMPIIVGQICRYTPCCPQSEGHNPPGWSELIAAQRVKEDAAKNA